MDSQTKGQLNESYVTMDLVKFCVAEGDLFHISLKNFYVTLHTNT